ncbi:hypothetical protein BDZ97DRAFT_1665555 [Flammula alnicola]|nr:hypothetical protein BDZ97DRAFT_1665555 [Flammula alnicola]
MPDFNEELHWQASSPNDRIATEEPQSELGSAGALSQTSALADPRCFELEELPNAAQERARVSAILPQEADFERSPLFIHLAHGLAYTTGSALGNKPPSLETCLSAYLVPNSAGLTAGSRAWSKHSHRSQPPPSNEAEKDSRKRSAGWWGITSGPVSVINENSLALFWKVMNGATWRNLHWLPHQVLVYEVRVLEGYGMRWSQDQGDREGDDAPKEDRPWMFRGFLEPTMENGHELKWRHPIAPT